MDRSRFCTAFRRSDHCAYQTQFQQAQPSFKEDYRVLFLKTMQKPLASTSYAGGFLFRAFGSQPTKGFKKGLLPKSVGGLVVIDESMD